MRPGPPEGVIEELKSETLLLRGALRGANFEIDLRACRRHRSVLTFVLSKVRPNIPVPRWNRSSVRMRMSTPAANGIFDRNRASESDSDSSEPINSPICNDYSSGSASSDSDSSDDDGCEPTAPFRILVTGGCGFLGKVIVRQLVEEYDVFVVDLVLPVPLQRCPGASYYKINLSAAEERSVLPLTDLLCDLSIDVVVHTAGLVSLTNNYGLLHNANLVATRNVLAAMTHAKVDKIVFTSSGGAVTSPYCKTPQIDLSSDFMPDLDTFPFASHYSRTKYLAERLVLSHGVSHTENHILSHRTLYSCALRLPGLYGVGDQMIVEPLLSGWVSHYPASPNLVVDFCYVENAAFAHKKAVEALLERPHQVAGRAFNVTNDDSEPVVQMWNKLLAQCGRSNTLEPMPYPLAFFLACLSEGIYFFLCGRVPFSRHSFWNFNRATLGFATCPITLSLARSKAKDGLQYRPLYNNIESFKQIAKHYANCEQAGVIPNTSAQAVIPNYRTRAKRSRSKSRGANQNKNKKNCQSTTTSDTCDIDWTIPELASSPLLYLLDILGGPGGSFWETGVTGLALLLCVAYAHISALSSWSRMQYSTAILLAIIDGSAAIQCSTAQNKRWYRGNRRHTLSTKVVLIIVLEICLQFLLVSRMFVQDWPLSYFVGRSGWVLLCLAVILGAPLHVQRPVSLLCFLVTIALIAQPLPSHILPEVEGLQWWDVIMALKYMVSHVPRHEPYV